MEKSMTEENELTGGKLDLSNVMPETEEGHNMTLADPGTGEPLADEAGNPVTILLAGRDSKIYRKAQRTVTNRRLQKRGSNTLTAERLESEANEVLSHCTLGWSGIVFQSEEMVCNYINSKKLYDHLPWVKEQVDEFVAERSNFLES
jgi:hypothetical protein